MAMGAEVIDLVAELLQPADERVLEVDSGMVGGKSDAHGAVLGDQTGIRQHSRHWSKPWQALPNADGAGRSAVDPRASLFSLICGAKGE